MKPEIAKKGVLARFARDCARCARRISLKIWPIVLYWLLHIVTFMLQPSKMQGEARNREKRRFGALRARLCALRAQDQLKIWPIVLYLLLHIVTFMLQPLKMQGEARNCGNGHLCALRARLRALRAHDHAAELVVPASWTDRPSVRVSSLWDNLFYHFCLAPFLNGGDPTVLFPLRTRLKKETLCDLIGVQYFYCSLKYFHSSSRENTKIWHLEINVNASVS